MHPRILSHRRAPTTEQPAQIGMVPGCWADVDLQGQFLMDLEFLALHTHPCQLNSAAPDTACVYTTSPPYLSQIAAQFPWVHFYAFRHRALEEQPPQVADEYDPESPALAPAWTWTTVSIQTVHNMTTSPAEFTRDNAVGFCRAKEARAEHRVVMICHGESDTRQAVLHALLRPDHSMLDLCGSIQREYLKGEIVLPMRLPNSKVFACLHAHASDQFQCVAYDTELYDQETAFFQNTIRASQAYDITSASLIVEEYAKRFHWYHRCQPEHLISKLQALAAFMIATA